MKDTVCPIHRSRQLSETGHCVDCGYSWTAEILVPFNDAYNIAVKERDAKIERIELLFDARIRQMQKDAISLNKSALNKSNKTEGT